MTSGVINKIKIFLEMIKFEHTIFALPFAYIGSFLGNIYLGNQGLPSFEKLLWITLAMVGARTAAMSLNRLIDRHIDARNPRTEERALPKGLLSVAEVWIYIILSFGMLILSAVKLNPLCVKLMPVAVFFLVIYSYMKRISWLCHIVLGISLGLAPVGAWVGVTGAFAWPIILLGLAVTLWVAGFDIIYACQDIEFDVKEGLNSIPSRFGINKSLIISSVFHIIAPILFLSVGVTMHLGWIYLIGVALATALLYNEHRLVKPEDLSKIGVAFMNMNGTLSVVMFVFTLADILLPSKIL